MPQMPEFYIDVNYSQAQTAEGTLSKACDQKKARVTWDQNEFTVYATISFEAMPVEQPGEPLEWHYPDEEQELAHIAFVDPRLRQMGTRILAAPQSFNLAGMDEEENSLNADDDLSEYNLLKLLLGIQDGPTLVNKSPMQFNFDKTNSISLNKRQYVGKRVMEELYYRPRTFQIWPAIVSKEPLGVRFPIDFVNRDYEFDTTDRSIYNDDMNPVG